MFTQVINTSQKEIVIEVPEEYRGHPVAVTVSEVPSEEAERYSFANALRFWKAHRRDLSRFTFHREEANER